MLKRNPQEGFSLIELLIVVAIIGLLASVIIPNLIDALHKSRQRRTMTDLRGLGTAWMSWMADNHGAASAGSAKVYDRTGYTQIGYTTLLSYLRPTDSFFYAQTVPQLDGWGRVIDFAMGIRGNVVLNIFTCSPGRDGIDTQCSQNQIETETFVSTDYDQDIIWADGYFLRYPEGLGMN